MRATALLPVATAAALLAAAAPAAATAPGANGRILFQAGVPGDLFSIAPTGATVQTLLLGNKLFSDAMWSPDGTRVVFSRAETRTAPVEIVVANADGSRFDVITRHKGFSIGAAWSPDGKTIAYATDEGAPLPRRNNSLPPRMRLHTVNADGTGDKRLLSVDRDVFDPVYSPDGRQIAFMGARPVGRDDFDNRIYVANADGSGAPPITRAGGADEQNASWCPDGTKIALELAPPGSRRSDIATMNPDGSGLKRLAVTKYWETNPVWSPDAKQIAFTSDRDTKPRKSERLGKGFELYTVGIDG